MRPYERTDELRQSVNELGARVYTALRDGGLEAGLLVELACLAEEWTVSTPATRELLERRTAELTAADVFRLGEALLGEVRFVPTYALEPALLAELEEDLKVVERDLRATGITGTLRVIIPDWDFMGMAWVEFDGLCQGNGIPPGSGGTLCVADAAQEVVMEVIWEAWPACPEHDLGLHAEPENGIAVWRCTGGEAHTVAPIGELPPLPRRRGPARRK
ncbi:hypothetical protein ACFQ08_29790 [Streptosporangium algeriense]|uniref:Uncharacterized protein n=1 Tax=Streptosporangium algeriense TaxID=1682748 RepID=A0ABW3DY68_9ACTN